MTTESPVRYSGFSSKMMFLPSCRWSCVLPPFIVVFPVTRQNLVEASLAEIGLYLSLPLVSRIQR